MDSHCNLHRGEAAMKNPAPRRCIPPRVGLPAHLVRLHDLNESLRDLVSGALDTYLSVVNNRLNDVMKTLTLITTLFMPISFITGFFGMNFFEPVAYLTGWTSLQTFEVTLGIMLGLPMLMYIWMRSRTWV
jgi:magnesium transporter